MSPFPGPSLSLPQQLFPFQDGIPQLPSAGLVPPGFQLVPISRCVTILDFMGAFLSLSTFNALFLSDKGSFCTVSSAVPRFPSGLSLPPPAPHLHPNSQQQGAAAIWFPCALPHHALASNPLQRGRSK